MKQMYYQINQNTLTLNVKKAPYFLLVILYVIAILSVMLPLAGIIVGLMEGEMHIGYLIGMFIFGFLAYKILRIALWNTFGSEEIIVGEHEIEYIPNYKWFKDDKRVIPLSSSITYSINELDEEMGTLIIHSNENSLECVTKIPIKELKEMIYKLYKIKL